jgi:hypothetical protein
MHFDWGQQTQENTMTDQNFAYRIVLPSSLECRKALSEKDVTFFRQVAQHAEVNESDLNAHFKMLKDERVVCRDDSHFLLAVFDEARVGNSKLSDAELYFGFIEGIKHELCFYGGLFGYPEVPMRTSVQVEYDPGKTSGYVGCGGSGNYKVIRPSYFNLHGFIDVAEFPEGMEEFKKVVTSLFLSSFDTKPGEKLVAREVQIIPHQGVWAGYTPSVNRHPGMA